MLTKTSRFGLTLGLLLLSPIWAHAEEALTLDAALTSIAKVVAEKVKEQNATQIVVNPITDTGDLTHTAGTGLTEKLIEKLKAEGLEPALKADLVFSGDYGLGEAENGGQRLGIPVGRLAFKVKRRNGKTLVDSENDIPADRQPRVTDLGDLNRMGGTTVALPPPNATAERIKATLEALDKPGLFDIEQETRIRPKGSPYVIEMLVAPSNGKNAPRAEAFRPGKLETRQGLPFLKVEPGQAIAVRIINESDHDAASTVSIDGLSMFDFRDDKADRNEYVIIKKHTAGDILGWYRDARVSSAFLVADLPQGHAKASLLKNPAKIGSITITFAAAWEKDNQRPLDEKPSREQGTEIVPGAPIEAPYETVRRQIGEVRTVVTIRYDKF
jgi:hypothetical protein